MRTVVTIRSPDRVELVTLLGRTTIADRKNDRGYLTYEFDPVLVELLRDSQIFAKLQFRRDPCRLKQVYPGPLRARRQARAAVVSPVGYLRHRPVSLDAGCRSREAWHLFQPADVCDPASV